MLALNAVPINARSEVNYLKYTSRKTSSLTFLSIYFLFAPELRELQDPLLWTKDL